MNKFENIYQDAALMRKFLLGEANEAERKELEKRLAECPDLKKVYEQLQNGETLKARLENIKIIHQRKLINLSFRKSDEWRRRNVSLLFPGFGGMLLRLS